MESHTTSVDNVGQDYKEIFMVWLMTICLMECVSEIWVYTKVCVLRETLAIVHELLYALIQKAGYHGHLRAMASLEESRVENDVV